MLESPNPGNGEAEARSEMSTPANTFARTRADSVHQWIEFIKGELGLCLTFCVLAAIKYNAGNRNSAERSIDHAEKAYAAVALFLSHRSRFKGLSAGEIQELTADAKRVREKLDALRMRVTNFECAVQPPTPVSDLDQARDLMRQFGIQG